MWSPTHVQVTVQRAKGLVIKGTNGVFVTIALGKEKYQTSVKKDLDQVEWREKCELQIPKHGNTAVIVLTALSHNFLGVDQFLGCVNIPLAELDVYERPKNKWYELLDKNGKKSKERGELEVKIGFSVKPDTLSDIGRRDARRASLNQLSQVASNVGGSLASISSVDKKSFKKLAKSVARKIKKDKKFLEENTITENGGLSKQSLGDADPGVVSDDEFALDDLSHTGSGCSLEVSHITSNAGSVGGSAETVNSTEATPASYKEPINNFNTVPQRKPPRSITPIQEKFLHIWEQKSQEAKKAREKASSERVVVGGEAKSGTSRLSPEIINQYSGKSREELIEMVHDLQSKVTLLTKEKKEMEDYIDNLLIRVIDTAPQILQNPYS